MPQHSEHTKERWPRFTRTQQLLQVAVELHRTRRFLHDANAAGRRFGYERVLELTDFTIDVEPNASLRSELLRLRDVIAGLYARDSADPETHELALRGLLELDPGASEQIPYLCNPEPRDHAVQ